MMRRCIGMTVALGGGGTDVWARWLDRHGGGNRERRHDRGGARSPACNGPRAGDTYGSKVTAGSLLVVVPMAMGVGVAVKAYLGSTGIELHGVCDRCSGDGKLATTERSGFYPEQYPDELIDCPECGGLGGETSEDGKRGRRWSAAYARALGIPE